MALTPLTTINMKVSNQEKTEIQTQSSFAVKLRLEELETQLQQAQQEAIYYRSQYEKLSLVQASQQENTASYQALSVKFDELLKGLEYVFGVAAELANEPHFRERDYTQNTLPNS
jgi:hypothetical protein